MKRERCPHCGEYGFMAAKLPKEVVAVITCRCCQELSVFFRDKVIPVSRRILESGTFEERKEHLAEVVARFLEAGLLQFDSPETYRMPKEDDFDEFSQARPQGRRPRQKDTPITDQELDRFVRIDLKCIDNPSYFRRIFG